MLESLALGLLAVAVVAMVLVRDWRPTVAWLLLAFAGAAGVLQQQPWAAPEVGNLLFAAEALTGLIVAGMLLITGLTFSRDYNVEDLDEFGLMELRRAARRAAHLDVPHRANDYVLPGVGLLVVLGGVALLPRLYAGPNGVELVDYTWTLLLLGGVLQLVISQNLLKIGGGLLLLALGLQMLYVARSAAVGLVVLALLDVAMLVLALTIAFLCGLLYGRLRTLDVGEVYRQGP